MTLVGAGPRCYVAATPIPGSGCQSRGRQRADRQSAATPRHLSATWRQVLVRSSTSVDGVVDDLRHPGGWSDV